MFVYRAQTLSVHTLGLSGCRVDIPFCESSAHLATHHFNDITTDLAKELAQGSRMLGTKRILLIIINF